MGANRGSLSYCYSIGSVWGQGDYVGGLVGNDWGGTITNSFWDIETGGPDNGIGTPLPTEQLQTMSTFIDTGWDFERVWWILEGAGYPRLCWEEKYGAGSGRPKDPYLIYTSEQMNTIGACQRDCDKCFKLMVDVDLNSYTGTSFNIIGSCNYPFTDVFNGNGHIISNFTYTSTDTDYIGLFRYVDGENAEIKNLGLIAPDDETCPANMS